MCTRDDDEGFEWNPRFPQLSGSPPEFYGHLLESCLSSTPGLRPTAAQVVAKLVGACDGLGLGEFVR